VASSVANLIYKPFVLEPGVLILVGSFQQFGSVRLKGSKGRRDRDAAARLLAENTSFSYRS
jgi:hypothetical protein